MTVISILTGKNPVAAGVQADDIAGLQLAVARRVDVDDGCALTRRGCYFGTLDRAEATDMPCRARARTRV